MVKYNICGIQKNGTDEPICRTAIGMPTERAKLWTQQRKERVGGIESSIETLHYQIGRQPAGIHCRKGAPPRTLRQPRGVRWAGRWEGH